MAKIIEFNENDDIVLECEHCGCQLFFVIMDDNNDITNFECANAHCKRRIEFNTITLTK